MDEAGAEGGGGGADGGTERGERAGRSGVGIADVAGQEKRSSVMQREANALTGRGNRPPIWNGTSWERRRPLDRR